MDQELTTNRAKAGGGVLLALLLAVPFTAAPAGGRAPFVHRAQASPATPASSALPTIRGGRRVRVQIFLSDNSLAAALTNKHAPLAGHMRGAAAAKREALRSPNRPTATERRIAASMDRQRNAQLSGLRAAAASGTAQSERVAALIAHFGGRVIDAAALPNSITALVSMRTLTAIKTDRAVRQIVMAPEPIWASSPVDGSETWHTAGFTGGGTSADGNGGPDYLAFDQGVTTDHQAFRIRLPDDSSTGLGTGPSGVTSAEGRKHFTGSGHGNNVAGIVASTDLRVAATSGPPYPPTWQNYKGLAYGLDKLYDPYEAQSPARWGMGITYNGEPGVDDLPEVLNYSAGIYEDTTDYNPGWSSVDTEVAEFGTTQTISAGNCGISPSIYTGCNGPGDTPHRVSTPGNMFNVITVGGLTMSDAYDSSTWTVWPNSSPGPTWGGRKKPDLIAPPSAGPCPANWNANGDGDPYNDYDNCGQGTSYAAPQAAAGAILLASTGIYKPATQKAILINTATPIQDQTYWMPRSGWGALNLGRAFTHRNDYEDGFVTAAGANSARFFRQNSVATGDKTTLVWNRRTTSLTGSNTPLYMTLTNLDLSQYAYGDACSPNCTSTAIGGVDANDAVDTNPTVSADNPMPGDGADGEDNVEQVRSIAADDQIIKVKANSTIDGATEEPFSLAANHTLEALQTPIPSVSLVRGGPAVVGAGDSVTVTATTTNPSANLALSGAHVTLAVPAGVTITAPEGQNPETQSIGSLAANETSTVNWTVTGSAEGLQNLAATASGTTYGELFEGSGAASFTVDATPPSVSIDPQPTWSSSAAPTFSWSATDALSNIDHFDVELSRNGEAYAPLLTSTTATAVNVAGGEGEQLGIRVRSADDTGNISGWSTQSVTIDAVPPAVAIGAVTEHADGTIAAQVTATNLGSPLTTSYVFGIPGSAFVNQGPVTGAAVNYTFARQRNTTFPVLTVTATDALGRAATASRRFTVAGSLRSANLSVRFKRRGRYLNVAGRLDAAATGKALVSVKRIGKSGLKRVKRALRIRTGRFSGRLRLSPGKYRVSVAYRGSTNIRAATVRKTIRIR